MKAVLSHPRRHTGARVRPMRRPDSLREPCPRPPYRNSLADLESTDAMAANPRIPAANVEQLVRDCFDSCVKKDRAAIEALLADDFHFSSPLDNRIDRKTYFEVCWPNSKRIDGFAIERLAVVGDHAFVTYEGRMGKERFRNTEVHTVRGNKITEVEVYFGWNVPHPVKAGTHED